MRQEAGTVRYGRQDDGLGEEEEEAARERERERERESEEEKPSGVWGRKETDQVGAPDRKGEGEVGRARVVGMGSSVSGAGWLSRNRRGEEKRGRRERARDREREREMPLWQPAASGHAGNRCACRIYPVRTDCTVLDCTGVAVTFALGSILS
jgi:hypothetical protein